MPLTLATLVDSVNFFNTTLWQQYRSAKKIEILTLTKIDFSKEKCHEKRLREQFSSSKFKNFLGGHAPRPPYQLAPLAMAMAAKAPSTKLFQHHIAEKSAIIATLRTVYRIFFKKELNDLLHEKILRSKEFPKFTGLVLGSP